MLVRRTLLEQLGRPRRGLLPLLRGHRPLPADPRGRLRACATSRRRSSSTRAARPRPARVSCPCSLRAASATRASTGAGVGAPCSSGSGSGSGRSRTCSWARGGAESRAGHAHHCARWLARSRERLARRLGAGSDHLLFWPNGRRRDAGRPTSVLRACAESAESSRSAGEPRAGRRPDVLDRMTDAMTHRGPERPRHVSRPGVALGARRLSIVDVEGGHQPFANEDGSVWAIQNGELYNHVDLRTRARRARAHVRVRAATPRSSRTSTSRHGDRVPGAAARECSGSRLGRPRAPRGPRARPARRQAALLRATSATSSSSRRSSRASSPAASSTPSSTTRRSTRYLTLGFVPGPMHAARAASRSSCPAIALVVEDGGVRVERVLGVSRAGVGRAMSRSTEYQRAAARAARRIGAAAPDERRAARRDAERRARLEPDRRADGAPHERARQDVLGRVRRGGRATSSPTRARRRRSSAPTTTSSSSRSPSRPSTSTSSSGTSTSRSPTCRRSGSWRSRELAAEHVTVALSGQGADELLGGYRKHRAASLAARWRRLPGPVRARRRARDRAARAGRLQRAARDARCARPGRRGSLAMSGRIDADLRRRARARRRSPDSTAARRERRPRPPRTASPTTRLPATLHLDGQLASSTTCSTTSIARRWRTRSRCACRSSITSWSSSAPRSRPISRSAG